MTELLYFKDPYCFEFKADVIEAIPLDNGNMAVKLLETYFYPTSGGQDHDEGWIGDSRVIDVIKQDEGEVIHILDRFIKMGIYLAKIDKIRRLKNMQAHTAQHILSRTFEMILGLDTVSSNISAVHPSTIDLNTLSIAEPDIKKVESKANDIALSDLKIKSYFISDSEIPSIPFRREPKVSGTIRVVEIDGYDYSACGGTHCDRTGSVGIIKILKSELQNQKIRIYFISGNLALEKFQEMYGTMKQIASTLETGLDYLVLSVNKQKETIAKLQMKVEEYRTGYFDLEKDRMMAGAIHLGNVSIVAKTYKDIDNGDIRALANSIRLNDGYLVVLSSNSDSRLSLVVGCSNDIGLDARQILSALLKKYNGKGGGDIFLAQGGGKSSQVNSDDLTQDTIKILKELLPPSERFIVE